MPKMQFKQMENTYTVFMDHLLKTKYKNLKKQEIQDASIKTNYKVFFQSNMIYSDFADLRKRTAFDKVLREKIFNTAENLKFDSY